jgi:hypothetical protein
VGEELNFGPLLIALLGAGVGVVGGYLVGVAQSRNARRDNALANIYREMSLFHRYLVSWIEGGEPDPDKTSAASKASGIPAKQHVREQYEKFTYTFHDVNAIWLGKKTYALIQEFSVVSRDFLNELEGMRKRNGVWRLLDGTDPKDRRRERRITPKYLQIRDALRAEVEASRNPVAWFRYNIVNMKNGAGRGLAGPPAHPQRCIRIQPRIIPTALNVDSTRSGPLGRGITWSYPGSCIRTSENSYSTHSGE